MDKGILFLMMNKIMKDTFSLFSCKFKIRHNRCGTGYRINSWPYNKTISAERADLYISL